jgi:glycosyltransferase involved in cell wall biosynthesis
VKVLIVAPRYPWPPRRGDQLRAVQALEALAAEHEVTLLAPEPPPGSPPPPGATPANEPFAVDLYPAPRRSAVRGLGRVVAGGWPLSSLLFWQPELARRLERRAPEADLVLLQLVRLAPHLDDLGSAPVLCDLIDSLALNAELRALRERPWMAAPVQFEAARLARAEARVVERSCRSLLVCERDRAALAARLAPAAAARLAVQPVAVAARTGAAGAGSAVASVAGGETIVFTGNLGYFVNEDALSWFAAEVWPGLAVRRPGLRLVVAGDRPTRRVRRAVARAGGRLLVAPADLGSVLAAATVAVAPLRCGSGVPLKVLEAWAAGVPVVASPHAAAGTTATPGCELRVADVAGEWVAAIEALLDDPAERLRLAAAGRERLEAGYGPAAVAAGWRRHAADAACSVSSGGGLLQPPSPRE